MSVGTKLSLSQADKIAAAVVRELAPACDRIEIAGSIRRRRPEIGDIEIVAVPSRAATLFGYSDGASALDIVISDLVFQDRVTRLKSGDRYKQLYLCRAECKLDLFLAIPENFGLILAIRTGPVEFSKRLVAERQRGGLLPTGWRVDGGCLWDADGYAVETRTEAALFAAIGAELIGPGERHV